jgi:Na+-transporting methylmalonyl-CoA/oxaloacetate decarboxylase gamma subunit
MNNQKLKELLATEILILIFLILLCTVTYYSGKFYREFKYDKVEQNLRSKIDSLNNNHFRNRYNLLNTNNDINDYTYDSYKDRILEEYNSSMDSIRYPKDPSIDYYNAYFRRDIYNRLCSQYTWYRNEKTFENFVKEFEYTIINEVDLQIEKLIKEVNEISEKSNESRKTNELILFIILLTVYPFRLLYHLIKWSINTLKKNNGSINNVKPKSKTIIEDKDFKSDKSIDRLRKNLNTKWLINLFQFKEEYISGPNYFIRILLGHTLIFIGVGFILIFATVYKRSISLGYNKRNSTIICIIVPILMFISSIISVVELTIEKLNSNDSQYYFYMFLTYFLLIPHIVLWFKNGKKKLII